MSQLNRSRTVCALLISVTLMALSTAPVMGQASSAARPGPPPPPPDPAIAYIENCALKVMNADGSNQQLVLVAAAGICHTSPTWSPDGKQLVFASKINGPGIYVINRDGTGLRFLITVDINQVDFSAPAWSPVPIGLQDVIAFVDAGFDGASDLYVVNLDATGLTNLTNSPAGEGYPSWDPLATRLVASVRPDTLIDPRPDLILYDIAYVAGQIVVTGQKNLTEVGPLANYSMHRPEWSRTIGRDQIVAKGVTTGPNDIWLVDVNDPLNPVNLTRSSKVSENHPCWSPDDTQIVFVRSSASRVSLYVMAADGSGLTNIGQAKATVVQEEPDWRRNP